MYNLEWIFDGIGTEIASGILTLLIGAIGGTMVYKIAIKRTAKQKQYAGDDSKQSQEMHVGKNDTDNLQLKNKTSIKQVQKAGDNATQVQIGEIKNDRR